MSETPRVDIESQGGPETDLFAERELLHGDIRSGVHVVIGSEAAETGATHYTEALDIPDFPYAQEYPGVEQLLQYYADIGDQRTRFVSDESFESWMEITAQQLGVTKEDAAQAVDFIVSESDEWYREPEMREPQILEGTSIPEFSPLNHAHKDAIDYVLHLYLSNQGRPRFANQDVLESHLQDQFARLQGADGYPAIPAGSTPAVAIYAANHLVKHAEVSDWQQEPKERAQQGPGSLFKDAGRRVLQFLTS